MKPEIEVMVNFDPRRFYRRLDQLLAGIEANSGRDLLPQVLQQLVSNFGDDLGIENGRLYREEDEAFKLVLDLHSLEPDVEGMAVSSDYQAIKLVLESGLYVFDQHVEGLDPDLEARLGGFDSAAILIRGRPRYIMAFGLHPGVDRDRLRFGLRAIQSTLRYRLRWTQVTFNLRQVREIHQTLLPVKMPVFPGFDIAAVSRPAELVGGDFYDFYPMGPEGLGLALGDASGHGLPAALQVRDVVIGLRMGVVQELKMVPMLKKLNQVIARSTISSRFVSLFYGELEQNGNLFYVNAGHPPPLLYSDGNTRTMRIGGPILGPLPNASFKRGFIHVDRGSVVVLYTDGISEAMNENGQEFGHTGIVTRLQYTEKLSAAEIMEDILEAAQKFHRDAPFEDDTSLMVIKRLP